VSVLWQVVGGVYSAVGGVYSGVEKKVRVWRVNGMQEIVQSRPPAHENKGMEPTSTTWHTTRRAAVWVKCMRTVIGEGHGRGGGRGCGQWRAVGQVCGGKKVNPACQRAGVAGVRVRCSVGLVGGGWGWGGVAVACRGNGRGHAADRRRRGSTVRPFCPE